MTEISSPRYQCPCPPISSSQFHTLLFHEIPLLQNKGKTYRNQRNKKGIVKNHKNSRINPKNRIFSTPKTQRTDNSSTKDQLEKIWIAPLVHLQ
jgi:hypothetical protein